MLTTIVLFVLACVLPSLVFMIALIVKEEVQEYRDEKDNIGSDVKAYYFQ